MEGHSKRVKTELLRSLIIANSPSGSKPSSSKGPRSEVRSLKDKDDTVKSLNTTQSKLDVKFLRAPRVRLTHSAPKEKVPLEVEKGSENTDNSADPQKKAVFFNIAQRKDILPVTTVSLRRDVNIKGSDSSTMKQKSHPQKVSHRPAKLPQRARSESPSKKKPLPDVYFKPEKVSQSFSKNDEHSRIALGNNEPVTGDRKVVTVAHCEVFALSDKSNKSIQPTSKSSNSLNMVPRPVAGFPSHPLRPTVFMIGRRKNQLDTSNSTTALAGALLSDDKDTALQTDLSVYSCERRQKDGITLPSKTFHKTQSLGQKVEHKYGVLNSSLLLTKSSMDTTPVPYNSCKTSMVGSDIFLAQENGMSPNAVSVAIENLIGDTSDKDSGKNHSLRMTTATTKTLGTVSSSNPTTRETSKYSSVTKDSKNSSSTIKGKSGLPSKYQTAQERYKSIIMDIYKKKGKDVQVLQNPMWKQGLPRSSSFGSKDEIKLFRGSSDKRQSSLGDLRRSGNGPKVTREGHIGGKKINPKPLSILGSKGGRDVIFSPTKGLEKPLSIQSETISLKHKPDKSEPSAVKDVIKLQEADKGSVTGLSEPVLLRKDKMDVTKARYQDDMKLEEVDEIDDSGSSDTDCDADALLQGTSSFRKINKNLSTQMVEYGKENAGEAMFTAGHYVDFQHAKFRRNVGKDPIKIPTTSYTDDVKTKFLKVKVGGNGDGKSVAE